MGCTELKGLKLSSNLVKQTSLRPTIKIDREQNDLKVPEAEWWWTAYNQLLQYGFWLSVSGVRCLLTLNTLETLPSAQMDISAVKGPVLWLQLFYNTTQKSNQREWHWVIFDLKSWLSIFHQGLKDLNGCQLSWNINHIIFRYSLSVLSCKLGTDSELYFDYQISAVGLSALLSSWFDWETSDILVSSGHHPESSQNTITVSLSLALDATRDTPLLAKTSAACWQLKHAWCYTFMSWLNKVRIEESEDHLHTFQKGAWNWERDTGTRRIDTSSSSSDATSPTSPTSSQILLMLY